MTKPLQVGELLGRYRLLERIGAGGMAEVFLAQLEGPEGFARKVAIKVVHPDTTDDGHLLSLVDEARVAGLLRHPNIVQVHELERRGEGFYLVMEYLEGRPLDQLLRGSLMREQVVPLDAVLDVGLQVLDALAYAHSANDDTGTPLQLVHRDIKPSNLMVSDRGLVTVVDFGIARAATLERRTETGVGKGTPAYMSPEQLTGAPVGPSSDLFSLATVLYEMATGHRLFQAGSLIQLVHRRQMGIDADDVERINAVDGPVAEVVLEALHQDPARRWQSADAMADALRPLTSAHPRTPLREWIGEITDPVASTSGRSLPTRQASVAAAAPEKQAAGVQPRWVRKEAEPGVTDTRLVDRKGGADPGPTRTVGPGERPRSVATYLAAGGLLLAVVGLAAFFLTPSTSPDPTPEIAAAPDPTPEPSEPVDLIAEVTDPGAPATSEAPPRATTPAPPAPEPSPEPAPTPVAELTPAPVASLSAPTAKASVYVNIVGGGGGQAEIAGHGRKETPGTFRVPAGRHVLRLLDQHDGLLADYALAVGAGEDARCLWKRSGATLTRVPDPDGAPCDVE